jgi:hypothetical protein
VTVLFVPLTGLFSNHFLAELQKIYQLNDILAPTLKEITKHNDLFFSESAKEIENDTLLPDEYQTL